MRAELFGHWIYWDAEQIPNAEYQDYIWDLNLSKNIALWGNVTMDLFFSVHNLFDGSQYLVADNPNPDRWVETGLKINF